MDNMKIYEDGRSVPENAKRTIGAGRLKGFTDVNPMWRIKRLTEMFGPCGIGWRYEVIHRDIQTFEGETCVFVDIMLYILNPETEKWSQGICGTGGSKLVARERSGAYVSDEAFKMAQTDALSVACKNLGIGADVYFEKDVTKYTNVQEKPVQGQETAVEMASEKEKARIWAIAKQKTKNPKEFLIQNGATYDNMTAEQYVRLNNILKEMPDGNERASA